jgi:hypothetical protein
MAWLGLAWLGIYKVWSTKYVLEWVISEKSLSILNFV